jgi:hypothetical protein
MMSERQQKWLGWIGSAMISGGATAIHVGLGLMVVGAVFLFLVSIHEDV